MIGAGADMGIELELGVLRGICVLGTSFFGIFEMVLPIALGLGGMIFHLVWCRRHGIHPLEATPRRRYYALRRWDWVE